MELKTTSDHQDGKQDQGGNRDPVRMWPALINLINSNASYWCAQTEKANKPESYDIGFWTMIAAAGACGGVVIAIAAAFVFWLQLGAMKDQLTEMRSGGVDTRNLADAAFANSRAWIVIKATAFQYRPDERRVPRVRGTIVITNTGPTPARTVHGTICGQVRASEPALAEYQADTKYCVQQSLGLIGKDTPASFNQDDLLEAVPVGSLIASTHDPGMHYYVWGNIAYNISATDQRYTIFCLVSGPDGVQFGACATGNDGN